MKSALRLACLATCVIGLPLALAACEGEKKVAEKGTAQGEILPGSASDAMLPYDTVRSQPPLAPLPTEAAKAGAKGGSGSGRASSDGTEEAADAGPGDPPAEEAAQPKAAE